MLCLLIYGAEGGTRQRSEKD